MRVETAQRKLRLRIKNAIESSFNVPTYVHILYDGSGSINPIDFRRELECGHKIISSFPQSVKIAASVFSWGVAALASFSASREAVVSSHTHAVHVAGGTATHLALLHAQSTFAAAKMPPESKKILLLLTDGCPDDQKSCVDAANALRAHIGCEIIGIGLGQLNLQALTEVCGPTNTFLLNSWTELAAALSLSPNSGKAIISDSEISIEATQTRVPIHLDAPIPLHVSIRNTGTVPVAEGSFFQLQDPNGYYASKVKKLPCIPVEDDIAFSLELKPAGRPQADQLPDVVQWTVKDPSGSFYFVRSDGFEIEIHNMFGEFMSWTPPSAKAKEANILLFGWTGAGKSRLVNSLMSIFADYQPRAAEELGAADHVTTELSVYKAVDVIREGQGVANLKFQFFDTYGLSHDTYNNIDEFDALMDGAMPLGWKRNDTRSLKDSGATPSGHRVDAVIFVLPQSAASNPDVLKATREFVARAVRNRKMAPIAVITHADEVEPEEWEDIRSSVKKELGLQNEVYMLDNSEKATKTFTRDRALYLILRSALNSAYEFIASSERRKQQ